MESPKFLKRITSSGAFIPELDGMRFLAITMVVLFHVWVFYGAKNAIGFKPETSPILNYLFHIGSQGVEIFFGISGFILALPFAKQHLHGLEPPKLKSYYWRRLQRLEPPYVISMLLLFVILYSKNRFPPGELFSSLFASIFYLHQLILGTSSRINGVAWSLEIEVQFYLIAPFLARIFRLPRLMRRSLLLSLVFSLPFLDMLSSMQSQTLMSYLHWFLCGFLVADLYLTELPRVNSSSVLGTIGGLAGLLGLLLIDISTSRIWHPIYAVCLVLFMASGLSCSILKNALRKDFSVTVGGMCYSIYLLHYAIISAVGNYTGSLHVPGGPFLNLAVQTVFLLPAVLVGSALFFVLFERPFMIKDWPSKFVLFSLGIARSKGHAPQTH